MPRPHLIQRFIAALVAAATAFGFAGSAQANVCRSIEAELATMSRGPSARERQIGGRAAWEAHRLHGYMRSIGCDRQTFLFFGQPPPAECGGYRARLAQLQAQSRAAYPPDEGRRRQLMSMLISYNCRSSPAPRSGPLTAGLFDDGSRRSGEIDSLIIDQPRIESRIRGPGGRAVCVRLCDGYYFPLDLRGEAALEAGDDACRSHCPATDTRLYFTPREIHDARTTEGEAYVDLRNAFRYRKVYDATCSCGKAGAPGAGAMIVNPAEGGTLGDFTILNPVREPEDLPLRDVTPPLGRSPNAAVSRTDPRPAPAPPPEVQIENLVTSDQGEVREVRGADGVTRRVRVIATTPSRAPAAAGAPSSPGRSPAP